MTVLVLTCDLDPTADLVINALNERGCPVARVDPGDFPDELEITASPSEAAWHGTVSGQHRDLPLDQIRSVYYRRPSPTRITKGAAEDVAWTRAEAAAGFSGVLASLDCLWVNHPADNQRAGSKPVALVVARRCGLPVPKTLITNNPARARDFVTAVGGTAAYKPLGATMPPEQDGQRMVLWTTRIHTADITRGVAATAHLFQEWIRKAYEVRLTLVGERIFAAEIHAHSDAAREDFRTDYDNLTYEPATVPDAVADGVRALASALRLRYAALDFLVNQDGDWFLVDVNPNGQFGFVPDLREPIATAIADLLEGTR